MHEEMTQQSGKRLLKPYVLMASAFIEIKYLTVRFCRCIETEADFRILLELDFI